MARALNRRELGLLLAGAVVLFVVLYLKYGGGDILPGADTNDVADKKKNKDLIPAPMVRMDLVDQEAEPFDPNGRDLFKYAQRPPSARELARMRAEAERARKEAEALAKRQAEEAAQRAEAERARQIEVAKLPPPPPPKPQPPTIAFKYIGYLGPKNARIAVFDDAGEMLLARKGETIREQFRVVDIKYDTVVMGFTNTQFQKDTRELPLTGKK